DGSNGSKPERIKQRGKILVALSAVLVVVVIVVAFALSSPGKAPEGGNEDKDENEGDVNTSDEVEEDKLVSGVASEFILNGSDMGADWLASDFDINLDYEPMNASITSVAGVTFEKLNSTGHLEYQVDIGVIVLDTTEDAMAYYNKTAVADRPYQGTPDVLPEIPIIIANVSVGDGGIILDGPHITLGHEAKWLFFVDRNVVCMIAYHHAWAYDILPNELLIDLANKVEAKIV
nr:hypothetical protein [bacterium]